MEQILSEIEGLLAAKFWYSAVALTLTLPDICASLEAPHNARPEGAKARYTSWFRRNLLNKVGLTPDECWELRCGIIHEGRFLKGKRDNRRKVAFTVGFTGVHCIHVVFNNETILSLHTPIFCNVVIKAVREWYEKSRDDRNVRENYEHLFRLRPNGFSPTIGGPDIIM